MKYNLYTTNPKEVIQMNSSHDMKKKRVPDGMLYVMDLNLNPTTFDIKLGNRAIETTGPTYTICSQCCLCEMGGV